MKITRIATCAALGFGLLVAGCKSKEQAEAERAASKGELDKLHGQWKIVSQQFDEDEESPEAMTPTVYYSIDGDLMKQVQRQAGGAEETLEIQKLHVAGDKEPKHIDLTLADEKGNPIKVQSTKKGVTGKRKKTSTTFKDVGIFKLEGDKLTICMSYDEKKRPTEFSAPRGTARYLLTLERIKNAADDKVKDEKKTEPVEVKVIKDDKSKGGEKKAKEEADNKKSKEDDN